MLIKCNILSDDLVEVFHVLTRLRDFLCQMVGVISQCVLMNVLHVLVGWRGYRCQMG